MSQTKRHSLLEALANTVGGYVLALITQLVVYPLYGASFTLRQNIEIGLIFMAVSIARGYLLRRAFNRFTHRSS